MQRAISVDPSATEPVLGLASYYSQIVLYDSAIYLLTKFRTPERWSADNLGWAYFRKKDYQNAVRTWSGYNKFEKDFEDSTQTVPFRHRFGMAYAKLGEKKIADSLFAETLNIARGQISGARSIGTWGNLGASYYDQGVCLAYFGKNREAIQSLDSAWRYGFRWNWGWHNDPVLEPLRNSSQFKVLMREIDDEYTFRKKAFGNALSRAQSSHELKELFNK